MGNDQTTLQHKDTNILSVNKYIQISTKHNKKICQMHIKNSKEFSLIMKSIYLRVSYLKYEWAKWLQKQIKNNPIKMYEEYCLMFKQSLMKKNYVGSTFHVPKFQSKFLQSFIKNAKCLQTTIYGSIQLQKVFEEAKCYLMVKNWFNELPLNSYFKNRQATQNLKQNYSEERVQQIFYQPKLPFMNEQGPEQKVYRVLLKLTEVYFLNQHYIMPIQENRRECQSPKMNPIRKFNKKQASLIKMISKESNFKQREQYIVELLDIIFKNQNEPQKIRQTSQIQIIKIKALTQILGLKNVYCVLKVLKQIGQQRQTQRIQIILQLILEKAYSAEADNDQNQQKQIKNLLEPQKDKKLFSSKKKISTSKRNRSSKEQIQLKKPRNESLR